MNWNNHNWQDLPVMDDPLSAFREAPKVKEVQAGMSPDEVAEIWSDRLIKVIKDQLSEAMAKPHSK